MKIIALYLLCLCALSCQKAVEPMLTGEVRIDLAGDFSGADSGLAEVAGSSMQITGAQLHVTDSTVSGLVDGIPAGENLTLTISLYRGSMLKYTGNTRFDLEDDTPLTVSMRLMPVDLPPSSNCRPAGIEIYTDTTAGLYTITWIPYEDSLEFFEGRFSYVLVFDTVRISDDFNSALNSGEVFYSDNQINVTSCTKVIGPEIRAYFRLFLHLEKYHEVIADCIERSVLVRNNGM